MERHQRLADRDERGGIRARSLLAQRHDRKEAEDADSDEGAFNDTSRDIAESEDFVHPLEDGIQYNGGADVRDDEDQLQERSREHAVVGASTDDVAGIVHHRDVVKNKWGIAVIKVITNDTPVTSAIFLCELTWTPFLDEVNDRRLPTEVVASPTLVERHAPAHQPPPRCRWNKGILRQEKFTHKAYGPGPIGLGAAGGQGG
jgi:hypothetical protein